MSEPYISEIRIVSFNILPRGWAECNGQLLPINQNQALFSLLGTTYGGNGQTNFALPNLQGRAPFHMGDGFSLGGTGGETGHVLLQSEMPAHTHTVQASVHAPDQASPVGNYWASQGRSVYSSNAPNAAMNSATSLTAGGGQPHTNMPPYLVLIFIIALQGIFPSRN